MALLPGTTVDHARSPPPPLRFECPSAVLLVGETALGPVGEPKRMGSVSDYTAVFGGTPPITLLDHAVRQFFGNGGSSAYVLRLEAPPGTPAFSASLTAALPELSATAALAEAGLVSAPGLADVGALKLLQAFARDTRKFVIIDSAETAGLAEVLQQAEALRGGGAMSSALYFPWIVYGGNRLPPGPAVAGLIARTDRERACWKSPAGVNAAILGATGLAQPVTARDQDVLNPKGICCLRQFAGTGVVAYGARTLAEPPSNYIAVRRLALALQRSLNEGLKWTVFEPNAEPLWARLRASAGGLMQTLFRQGAFQGRTPGEAYFVRCGLGTTMTEQDKAAGRAILEAGFAPLRPREFFILNVECTTAAG